MRYRRLTPPAIFRGTSGADFRHPLTPGISSPIISAHTEARTASPLPPASRDGLGKYLIVMPWIYLFVAALLEITWAVGLKYTDGFTRLWPSIGTATALILSVALLGMAAKSLPIGTAYAVWTGIGTAGAVICGILLLGDAATPARLVCVGLILLGVIGLKMS